MRTLSRLLAALGALGRRRQIDAELDQELQSFFDASVDARMAAGLSREAAEREARLELGSRAAVRDWVDDVGWESMLRSAWADVRFAARVLRRSPAFLLVAVVTLALGTGANAAIFQLLNAVRFQPLPVERPHELLSVGLDRHGKQRVGMAYRRGIYTVSLWEEIRSQQQAFSSLIAWGSDRWDLSAAGEFVPAQGLYVSGSFFEGLGLRPHAGRLFTAADDQWGCADPGVVLSHATWRGRYGGDPAVVGRTVTLNRRSLQVIGVAPPGFFGVEVGRGFDAAVPLCAEPLLRGERTFTRRQDAWWLDIMGRLEPGWTTEAAEAHLAAISPAVFGNTVPSSYNAEFAASYRASTLTATPAANGVSALRTQYAPHLWLLFAGTGLVLLITCANLANLMLARATARDREVAVRLAIGASRGRVVRQMLAESLIIAGAGVLAGLALAHWLSRVLVAMLSPEGAIVLDLQPDWRLFGFASIVAVVACALFGLAPALRVSGTNPGRSLQPGGRSGTESRSTLGMRRVLVVAQLAVSVVLVVAALLFARSLRNLTAVELGFDPGVLVASVDFSRSPAPSEARLQLLAEMVERTRNLPGVTAVSEAFLVPLGGAEWNGRIAVGGELQNGMTYFNAIGSEYFRVLGIEPRVGRTFDERDTLRSVKTAVVNETFARRYLRSGPAIGQRFEMEGPSPRPSFEVIGVVPDSKQLDIREEPLAVAYLSMAQDERVPPLVALLVRTDLPQASVTPSLTAAITASAPGASVSYDTIERSIDLLVRTDRVMTSLAVFFGLLAVLIAVIGLYGVMSYSVTRRQTEIGIRMALGADADAVRRMMLRESAVLLSAGAALGLLLAFGLAGYAERLLYGLTPRDPASLAFATGVLVAVGLLAAWIPAHRAARLDPTLAMRE